MQKAGEEMRQALAAVEFAPLTRAHAPNTIGQPTQDAQAAKAELMNQLTSPVRWVQTIEALLAQGVDAFIEAGPKNVLTGLIKKTAPEGVAVLKVEDPASLEAALAVIAGLA
jgi:[acyl-carrier-protein] S-malonyltransferase